MTHIGARAAGCIDENAIQHGPPRRAEILDAILRLDAQTQLLAAIMKRRGANFRCSRGHHCRQQSPSLELKDSRAHQGVSRHRVGAVGLTVDRENIHPCAREKHRRGSPGASGSDDHRVVVRLEVTRRIHLNCSVRRPSDAGRDSGARQGPQHRRRPRR